MGACFSSTHVVTGKHGATLGSVPKNYSKASSAEAKMITAPTTPEQARPSRSVVTVTLKKTRPGCTGMFWREDPTGLTQLEGGYNWPRDGAKLIGTIFYDQYGDKWLMAKKVLQIDSDQWVDAPPGAAMPFKYEQYYLDEEAIS